MKTEHLLSNSTPRSSLFLTKSSPRLVIGTTEYSGRKRKLVSLVRPSRLPLPFSYCRVEVFPAATGVDVHDPDSGKALCHLDVGYDYFEEEWASLLPVFSRAYLEGDTDAREFEEEQQ